jgi:hypothetical protein
MLKLWDAANIVQRGKFVIPKMPHYWWMDQENVVFIHNGILLSHEEEWTLIICR